MLPVKIPFTIDRRTAMDRRQIQAQQCATRSEHTAEETRSYLVNLDSGDDFLLIQDINEGLGSVDGRLIESLLEENGSGNVLADTGSADEQLTVSLSVRLGVLQPDGRQSEPASGIRLVHGEDSASGRGNRFLRTQQFSFTSSRLPTTAAAAVEKLCTTSPSLDTAESSDYTI